MSSCEYFSFRSVINFLHKGLVTTLQRLTEHVVLIVLVRATVNVTETGGTGAGSVMTMTTGAGRVAAEIDETETGPTPSLTVIVTMTEIANVGGTVMANAIEATETGRTETVTGDANAKIHTTMGQTSVSKESETTPRKNQVSLLHLHRLAYLLLRLQWQVAPVVVGIGLASLTAEMGTDGLPVMLGMSLMTYLAIVVTDVHRLLNLTGKVLLLLRMSV